MEVLGWSIGIIYGERVDTVPRHHGNHPEVGKSPNRPKSERGSRLPYVTNTEPKTKPKNYIKQKDHDLEMGLEIHQNVKEESPDLRQGTWVG